jgi:hypothetical protein
VPVSYDAVEESSSGYEKRRRGIVGDENLLPINGKLEKLFLRNRENQNRKKYAIARIPQSN